MNWQPIETRPEGAGQTYLVANSKGQVAPWIRGVIHNNPGTAHDWQYGEAATHWMPLPEAPNDDWCVGTGPENIDKVAVCSACDAHLIAAAPDLLDALKELRGWYQEHTGLPACAANAAISKATGAKP